MRSPRQAAATVRDVYEALREHRVVAYTTVMTMMNILEGKGHLVKRPEDRAYVYEPAHERTQVGSLSIHVARQQPRPNHFSNGTDIEPAYP
jgi:predicted transcriptional regulator